MLAGAVFFVVTNGALTIGLQWSLILYKATNSYIYGTVILIILPLLTGLVLEILEVPKKIFVILFGVVVLVSILFPFYSYVFWAKSPPVVALLVYMIITFFMAQIPTKQNLLKGLGVLTLLGMVVLRYQNVRKGKGSKITKLKSPSNQKARKIKPTKSNVLMFDILKSDTTNLVTSTVLNILNIAAIILGVFGVSMMGGR